MGGLLCLFGLSLFRVEAFVDAHNLSHFNLRLLVCFLSLYMW